MESRQKRMNGWLEKGREYELTLSNPKGKENPREQLGVFLGVPNSPGFRHCPCTSHLQPRVSGGRTCRGNARGLAMYLS